MRTLIILLLFSQHYLLMDPIQKSFEDNDFSGFKNITTKQLIVNLESPLSVTGDFKREKFIEKFGNIMKYFTVEKSEWVSKHIWEDFAVQSMNLIMKNMRSGDNEYYKFIFFLKRVKGDWKLYYLRGIKL